MQNDLFSAASLASTIQVPVAPAIQAGRYLGWCFPGSTPTECAQAQMAQSSEYADMLAAIIKTQGGVELSSDGVKALIPEDWRKLMGKHLHATMTDWQCKPRGIELHYLMRPGGMPVYMYRAEDGAAAQKGGVMAKKVLSGARWFDALGRRERSKGLPGWTGGYRSEWPAWARRAYHNGWYDQGLTRAAQKGGI